jgi:hypothetical protein
MTPLCTRDTKLGEKIEMFSFTNGDTSGFKIDKSKAVIT